MKNRTRCAIFESPDTSTAVRNSSLTAWGSVGTSGSSRRYWHRHGCVHLASGIWCLATLAKVELVVEALKMLVRATCGKNCEAGVSLRQGVFASRNRIYWTLCCIRWSSGRRIIAQLGSLTFRSISRFLFVFVGRNKDAFASFSFPATDIPKVECWMTILLWSVDEICG